MGARAIYKPLPQIPDELRRRAMNLVAVARFRVAADGEAQVELIQATPDPQLNRALLAVLTKWRFFPALREGSAVASSVEIRIPLKVE
jgi:periplasmic protein TonB